VYEFDFQHQQVRQYKIPPEQQGKSIAEGPLPFIFGAKAGQLKSRYWIRLIPPPAAAKGQVWLEIYPKYQQDAANFRGIDLILSGADLQPFALQVHHPTQQGRTVYQFQKITVNGNRLRQIFEDPFRVDVPRGWQIVSGDIPQAQSSMPQPPAGARPAILGNRQPAFDGRRE
jgi:TIGR03009 family protein